MEFESTIQPPNLEDKIEELIKIKEALKKAKEKATQSWLDSRPLIDELESLNKSLAITKIKNSESKTLISNLEAEVDATESVIKSKKDEELRAAEAIEELNRALEQLRDETETLKRLTHKGRQKKLRLKHVLRVKKQKLRSVQLRLEAAKIETAGYNESKKEALRCVSFDETEVVRLSHEEYEDLKKRAKAKNGLVNRHVLAAEEEKAAAEKSLGFAKAKWRELKKKRFKRVIREDATVLAEEKMEVEEVEEIIGEANKMVEIYDPKKSIADDKLRPSLKENYNRRIRTRRAKSTTAKKNKKDYKKQKSFFFRMRQYFVLNIIKRFFW